MICIPSTSGSAAEVTPSALITDPTIPAKCTIHSSELVPYAAIIDPDIADSMPKPLQSDTACDALTHAVAGYVNLNGNDVTRKFCLQAAKILFENLPKAYQGNKNAKEQVHYAATIAGLGFGNCGLGVEHPIASMVGASFHVTHGRACSTALPYVVRFNSIVVGDLYAKLARGVGFKGSDKYQAVDYLIKEIMNTKKQLEMPDKFKDIGIPENEYLSALDGFVKKRLV